MSVVPSWVSARLATIRASLFEGYLVCIDRGDRVSANAIWDYVERLDLELLMMTHIMETAEDDADVVAAMAVLSATWAKDEAADEAFDATLALGGVSLNLPMEVVDWTDFTDMAITVA